MAENEGFWIQDERTFPFFEIDKVVVDFYMQRVGVYAFAVYCALCRHSCNGELTIARRDIAKMLPCSLRTLISSLEDLEKAGLIGMESGKDAGMPNTYYILQPPPVGGTNG
jgi:hypothetical protein